ncbi:dihydrolipoamide dehydrogenase [Pelagirhabdus alkalitolerans]|uniref:Dihydrolipoyl dehydrogenase n=1 Tax=Pelagirhabdus alkalitolerans TaxID=1612202 RepID=A0A1G6HCX1_9BACI|nr:dihydrolipoyl dehydrogenase [Pelagirhabdus alkalitolerans]SDB92003.1 dihydrolipoamide dehydrogenase [Pelagirhabdus alkalitolerans]
MVKNYDLVILGGGIGGYTSAIRAKQLGLTVALVEADKLGGTCLHKGCIPSKVFLKSASVYQTISKSDDFGIESGDVGIHLGAIQNRKNQVINTLYEGVKHLMKKHKIDIFDGFGRLLGPSIFSPVAGAVSVEFDDERENEVLVGENVIIASGSKPKSLSNLPFDHKFVLSSDDMFYLDQLPFSIVIVGGGVIGIEWASMLADFDVQVTVVEAASSILPEFDHDLSNELRNRLQKKGITIYEETKVRNYKQTNQTLSVEIENNAETINLEAERLLVSVGREANIEQIGLENTSIQLTESNTIKVNENYQTKESHIYAIGDCIGGAQLAHVAGNEGKIAVGHLANQLENELYSKLVVGCVYSSPEVAMVGLTENEAKQQGLDIIVKKCPFSAIGKAHINGDYSGFIKLIVDRQSKDVIGVHMIGSTVTELISEAGLSMILNAEASEIASLAHPHPSLSEAFQEASLSIDDQMIHG